jgi:hypothetical protein
MKSGAHHGTMSTMLMLDTVIKQARELRGEVSQAGLYPAEARHFERTLNDIERRAMKLFAKLV